MDEMSFSIPKNVQACIPMLVFPYCVFSLLNTQDMDHLVLNVSQAFPALPVVLFTKQRLALLKCVRNACIAARRRYRSG